MTISAGSRLGPYEIVARLGAGGMGEVWRARDTRLDRTVAIKALPSDFAADAHLRVRLEREAKAISSLNHPHICTLYDIGHENGLQYLVMEYVDGESLAARLARGPLPLSQVVRYGAEIAGALERAHKAGIVHRDLKPGNIMITKSGAKLLDFGLAKPLDPPSDTGSATRALTEEGRIVGTLQYMAPEQLEGGEVDHRADLFALGAVLHEMATGRRVFGAPSRAGVMGAILSGNPDPIAPPALDRLVRTCLAKDPEDRFQSAHDVKVALQWVADDAVRAAASRSRRWAPWAVAALLAAALAGTAVVLWRGTRGGAKAGPVRLSIVPPPGHQFEFLNGGGTPALSPDGTMMVFPAGKDGLRRLWLRRLDSASAEPLAGSEQAINPFWSPDSRAIGFFANDKLMRLDIGGKAPVVICDAPLGRGASWNAEGTIVFAGRATPIMRVPASGNAAPVAVTELNTAEVDTTHRWPFFLPDGRHFLYVAAPSGQALPTNAICVGSLDRKMRKVVTTAPSQPLFVDGFLLFTRDDTLHAQRFDPSNFELTGEPIMLAERNIAIDRGFSQNVLSVSRAGTLAYQAGPPVQKAQLVWYSRAGKELGAVGEPSAYSSMSLSRDGRFLVFAYNPLQGPSNIWSYDLESGVKTRLTFGGGRDSSPLLSPDGRQVVYTSIPAPRQRSELRLKDLTSGADTALQQSDMMLSASDWSLDGRTLLIGNPFGGNRAPTLTRADIWWMALEDRKLRPLIQTPNIETTGRFSPDGKWVLYQSEESGPLEVYLAPFPPTGAKWQVSEKGGFGARWRADGKELYYVTPDNRLMAVPITLGKTPVIGRAIPLFQARPPAFPRFLYAVAADGQRFLVNRRLEDELPQPVTVVLHFDSELRAAAQRR